MKISTKIHVPMEAEQFLNNTEAIYNICKMLPESEVIVSYKNRSKPIMCIIINGQEFELSETEWIVEVPFEFDACAGYAVMSNEDFEQYFEVIE